MDGAALCGPVPRLRHTDLRYKCTAMFILDSFGSSIPYASITFEPIFTVHQGHKKNKINSPFQPSKRCLNLILWKTSKCILCLCFDPIVHFFYFLVEKRNLRNMLILFVQTKILLFFLNILPLMPGSQVRVNCSQASLWRLWDK